jgi:hypothetical protein
LRIFRFLHENRSLWFVSLYLQYRWDSYLRWRRSSFLNFFCHTYPWLKAAQAQFFRGSNKLEGETIFLSCSPPPSAIIHSSAVRFIWYY